MERENDITNRFIEYLKLKGYPNNSIAMEYSIGKYFADIMIIDPITNIPIQIFEIKNVSNGKALSNAKEQLKTYLSKLEIKIPAYIVCPDSKNNGFKIYEYDSLNEISAQTLDYEPQLNARKAENTDNIINKKRKKTKWFNIVCFSESIIIITILILKKMKLLAIDITLFDLIITGVAIILSLLPFFSKISFNNIEFIRQEKVDS